MLRQKIQRQNGQKRSGHKCGQQQNQCVSYRFVGEARAEPRHRLDRPSRRLSLVLTQANCVGSELNAERGGITTGLVGSHATIASDKSHELQDFRDDREMTTQCRTQG